MKRDVLGDPFWAYLCSVTIGSSLRLPYRGGFVTYQFRKVRISLPVYYQVRDGDRRNWHNIWKLEVK